MTKTFWIALVLGIGSVAIFIWTKLEGTFAWPFWFVPAAAIGALLIGIQEKRRK